MTGSPPLAGMASFSAGHWVHEVNQVEATSIHDNCGSLPVVLSRTTSARKAIWLIREFIKSVFGPVNGNRLPTVYFTLVAKPLG